MIKANRLKPMTNTILLPVLSSIFPKKGLKTSADIVRNVESNPAMVLLPPIVNVNKGNTVIKIMPERFITRYTTKV